MLTYLSELRFLPHRIILAHGCFDVLHVGHLRHLRAAKRHCWTDQRLVVTITPDRFVNKGTDRPFFPEKLRAEAVAALEFVDYVAINEWPTAVETIKFLRPSFYAKGSENKANQSPGFLAELAALKEAGGNMLYTDELEFHSTDIIEKLKCLS